MFDIDSRLCLIMLGALLLSLGCSAEDTDAPPAPIVDAVVSPTSLNSQLVSGVAEYGSNVTITGGAEVVGGLADDFTARFLIEVPLNAESDNALKVTATDAAGNTSPPALVSIVHEAPGADTLQLIVADPVVSADVGRLSAIAILGNDESAVSLAGIEVTFSVGDLGGVADVVVPTDEHGVAEVTFEGLTTTGAGTLTATGGAGLSRAAPFEVVQGEPTGIELLLSTDTVAGSNALEGLAPGTVVSAEVVVTDRAGNTLAPPIVLTTDAPGALIGGLLITGVTRAGTWTVAATVLGSGLTVSANMGFVPGPPAVLALDLDRDVVLAGETVLTSTTLQDAFGNVVAGDTPQITLDPTPDAPEIAVDGSAVTVEGPTGRYNVTATVGEVRATRALTVLPADLATFTLMLDDADDPDDVPTATLVVAPDARVNVTVVAQDALGNPIEAPVAVTTNSRGVFIDGALTGITQAGTWSVVAGLPNSPRTASALLTVVPGPVAEVDLSLSARTTQAGEPVTVSTTPIDAYGNAIPDATFTLSLDEPVDAPAEPIDGDTITIEGPTGAFTVRATLDGDDQAPFAATAPLTVLPAELATFTLMLDDADDNGDAPTTDLTLGPDARVNVTIVTEDVFGNPGQAPFALDTNAPGALLDGVLSGVEQAGSYLVVASLVGTTRTASARFVVEPGPVVAVDLDLSADSAEAGAALEYGATAIDAFGNAIPGATFTYGLDVTPTAPADPFAGGSLTIEAPAGSYTLTATLEGGGVTGSAPLQVTAGPPAPGGFIFALLAPMEGPPQAVVAGGDVDYIYSVTDAFDNPVPTAVVDVDIDAPGAIVRDSGGGGGALTRLRVAGSYTASARVRGTPFVTQVPLDVLVGPATDVALITSTNRVLLGDPINVFFVVTDALGNTIPDPSITLGCSDAGATCPSPAVDGDEVIFSQVGTHRLTATETGTGASDVEYVAVTTNTDVTPPLVTIASPADGADLTPGGILRVTVDASDEGGLRRIGLQVRGLEEALYDVLLPTGTTDASETFDVAIPLTRYGALLLTAFAEDESGLVTNTPLTTARSQHPAVRNISCDACTDIDTVAAGFTEGSAFPNGSEGGIRNPQELVVGPSGELYVAMGANIRLQDANEGLGISEVHQYIALILPDDTVKPYATVSHNDNIANLETIGMAYDASAETLYATLGRDRFDNAISRIIAITPGGVIDPVANSNGAREYGLLFTGDRLLAVDTTTDPDRVYSVETDPTINTVFTSGNNGMFGMCLAGDTLYVTRDSRLVRCTLDLGPPASCSSSETVSDDPDITASSGELRSCEVAPSGRVIVANRDAGTVVSVDPVNGPDDNNAVILINGLSRPTGVTIDPASGDLLVTDSNLNAVFRFKGSF